MRKLSWEAMQSGVQEFSSGPVRGYLHLPPKPAEAGLVLTHGAGGSCVSPLLVSIAEALTQFGLTVLRYDLPFRQRRKFGPPFGTAAEDRGGLSAAAKELRNALALQRLFLGGHSYGGRQASILAVEEPGVCDGLLLLSYPLHPPRRPQDLRTDHFRELRIGATFVHGTADPFGSVKELRDAVALIPGPTWIEEVQGVGHDLGKGKLQLGNRITSSFPPPVANFRA